MTELPLPGTRAARQREAQPPTVAIALFVGFVVSAAFTGLVAVVIPGVLLMVLAGFGMLIFFVLQYFLWARWLYPIVMKMEAVSPPDHALHPDNMPVKNPESDP